MGRRKRKRKHKQDSHSASPVTMQGETEKPTNPVVTQIETEISASYFDLHEEIEKLAYPVETRAEIENPASPAAISAHTKEPVASSAVSTGADRRTHPRYAFNAAVEVVATQSAARSKGRARDLSQQGCYVDTDSPLPLGTVADLRISKGVASFAARARVVFIQPAKGMGLMFTTFDPEHFGTLNTWITESRETSWLAANRRRSQRVLMNLPVHVSGQAGAAALFEEETHTVAISAHGALIAVSAPVYRGQRITLLNLQTKAALECVVAFIDKFPGEQIQMGVEFMLPNPTFWRVAFPPKDWTPRHPHAKSRLKS